jgi:sugar/nucleoside kinase (ribokinase family)
MTKTKMVCIFLFMLFIAPACALSATAQGKPLLEITAINGLMQRNLHGVEAVVTNTGDAPATNVAVVIEITGGFFIKHRVAVTTVDTLAPGDTVKLPLLTFGYSMGKIFRLPQIIVTAQATNAETVQSVAQARVIGLLFIIR